MKWTLDHAEGKMYGETAWYRNCAFARGVTCPNGVELREGYRYNGSGNKFFGGASQWPVVTLHVSLPEGRLDLRRDLAQILMKGVDKFLADHDLEGEGG
jgi:hypothetical protein